MLIHKSKRYFCLFLISLRNYLCISINSPLSLKYIHIYYLTKIEKKQELFKKKSKFLALLLAKIKNNYFVIYLLKKYINSIKGKLKFCLEYFKDRIKRMEKKHNFIKGVISLIASQIVIKILGMIYSLYLTNKEGFGDTGNAIYMSGYQIYALFLTISSIGVPNAISKLVSEKLANGDEKAADRIFKVAFITFGLFGFLGTITLFLGAKFISNNLLQIPEAKFTLMFLSPAVFFVSVSSVMEGYFNGRKELHKTAKAQSVEQFLKMLLTISIVEFIATITGKNTEYMAAGANFATSLATMLSVLYLIVICFKTRRRVKINKFINYKQDSILKILINIAKVSVPLAIGALLVALNNNIDAMTVVRNLKPIVGEEMAQIRYGILTSKVDVLLTVPLSFNMAFSVALIPEIASAKVRKDEKEISKKVSFSILISMLLAIPSMIGLYIYADEILKLLFPNASSGGDLLKLAVFAIPFQILVQTINGALQGLGKLNITTMALCIGTLVKLIGNVVFLKNSVLLEKGAILSTICCYFTIFCIVGYNLCRNCKLNFSLSKFFIKPIIASIIMAYSSKFIYFKLLVIGLKENLVTIIAIFMAIIIYVICVFLLRILSNKELSELTNNEKNCK